MLHKTQQCMSCPPQQQANKQKKIPKPRSEMKQTKRASESETILSVNKPALSLTLTRSVVSVCCREKVHVYGGDRGGRGR